MEAGEKDPCKVRKLMEEHRISARLTFSNSLIRKEHLWDKRCNALCTLFEDTMEKQSGVIVHSYLLLDHIIKKLSGTLLCLVYNKGSDGFFLIYK